MHLFDYSGSCDALSKHDVERVNIINTGAKRDLIFFKCVFLKLACYIITNDVPSTNQLHFMHDNVIILGEINYCASSKPKTKGVPQKNTFPNY